MKRILLILSAVVPVALFANNSDVQTDILERTVNFFIFAAILYYLLADKLKTFFNDRTKSIQAELDKVQNMKKASEQKVADAKQEIENAKKVAVELVESANNDIEAIKTNNYDLVLTDIMMPQIDGIELLRQIKQYNKDIKVIMMTAYSTLEKTLESEKLGANDYITKPFVSLKDVENKILETLGI